MNAAQSYAVLAIVMAVLSSGTDGWAKFAYALLTTFALFAMTLTSKETK